MPMAPPIALPQYTIADLDRFADDGMRYELLEGMLLVSPGPGARHQVIVSRIAQALFAAIAGRTDVLVATPGVIQRGDRTQLLPDLMVAPLPSPVPPEWTGMPAPWLVVEVLSPSTRRYDTDFKEPAYRTLGADETWLVDPEARTVAVWGRDPGEGRVERVAVEWRRSELGTPARIDLAALFRDLPARP